MGLGIKDFDWGLGFRLIEDWGLPLGLKLNSYKI